MKNNYNNKNNQIIIESTYPYNSKKMMYKKNKKQKHNFN